MNNDRINVYGTSFSNTNLEEVKKIISEYDFTKPSYICFPSTNIVSKAYKNKYFQNILNNAFLTIPDGKITEVYGRVKGYKKIKTISGYDMLRYFLSTNLTHYFYGGDPGTLKIIKDKIENQYPSAKVLGYKSPPMVSVEEIYPNSIIEADIREISALKPDLIWIGISNIKQDYLMYNYLKFFDHGLMLGVGAVFLYFADKVKRGPMWLKKLGLRWVYRLIQEPKKEFKKTVPSTLFFVFLVLLEIVSNFSFNKKK